MKKAPLSQASLASRLPGSLAVAFWMVASPSLAQAPAWSRGQQLLSITYEECVRRGPQALRAEGYRIDHAAGNFSVGIKEVHTAVIMCNPVPGEKEVVNIVVGSNGDGGGCHRERLQAQMERATQTGPIAPPCTAAQPQTEQPQPPQQPPPQPQPQPQAPPQPPPCSPGSGIIHVVSATYASNHSNVPRGNATRHLESECNGKTECAYKVDATVLGDPAYGSSKEYVAEYNCGAGTPPQKVSWEGSESHGRIVTLRCVPCSGASGANARVFQRARPPAPTDEARALPQRAAKATPIPPTKPSAPGRQVWDLVSVTNNLQTWGSTFTKTGESSAHMDLGNSKVDFQWSAPPQRIGGEGFTVSMSVQASPAPGNDLSTGLHVHPGRGIASDTPLDQRTLYVTGKNGVPASGQGSVKLRPTPNAEEIEINIGFNWGPNFKYSYRRVR